MIPPGVSSPEEVEKGKSKRSQGAVIAGVIPLPVRWLEKIGPVVQFFREPIANNNGCVVPDETV